MTTNGNYTFRVRVNNRQVDEYRHNSKTYIEGRSGSEYELFFQNHTSQRVLVIFSVDGLDVMDGKPASEDSRGYIVDGFDTLTVPGWTIDNSKVAKFQFTPQGGKKNKTYVEELAKEGFDVDVSNQGVIGCMVFIEKINLPKIHHHYYHEYTFIPRHPIIMMGQNTWSHSEPSYSSNYYNGVLSSSAQGYVNNNSSPLRASAINAMSTDQPMEFMSQQNYVSEPLGTGFGEDKTFSTRTVTFEKASMAWTSVIYYDTIQGLRNRGVPVDNFKDDEKQAFPGQKGCYVPKSRRKTRIN